MPRLAIIPALFLHSVIAFAQDPAETLELPPIIKEGSPAEALAVDPVLPSRGAGASLSSGSGSFDRGLQNRETLPILETGRPGDRAQFRGLGIKAEDVDVQSLGIPLNPPQGGGFDLSQFPQFMWSGYTFQSGPSLAAVDPSAAAGTLVLQPWTADALTERKAQGRATILVTDNDLHQFSGAVSTESEAALIGYTGGDAKGPSGSVGIRWERAAWSGKFHLLGTSIEAPNEGSALFPSPGARRFVTRLIPVAQVDRAISARTLFKSSFFADGTYLRNDDPNNPFNNTRDQIRQYGTELALLHDEWRFGASLRRVSFQGTSFSPPAESIASVQASRLIEGNGWLVDPGIRFAGVTGYGFRPEASLGIRRDLSALGGLDPAAFARASYSRRYPSMQDRFYSLPPIFVGNPDLEPETDYTLVTGIELKGIQGRGWAQLTGQYRQDVVGTASVIRNGSSIQTTENQGAAWVTSAELGGSYRPTGRLEVWDSLTLARGRIVETGTPISYLPAVTNLLGLSYVYKIATFSTIFRMAGPSYDVVVREDTEGYGYLDLQAGFQLHPRYRLVAGVQNVLDRRYEVVRGYPNEGRILSLLLTGQF